MNTMNADKIKQTLSDYTDKINKLKAKAYGHQGMRDDLDKLILDMEKIRDKIKKSYEDNKDKEDSQWDAIEKNIYKDIKSFDDAFRKAGQFFDPKP